MAGMKKICPLMSLKSQGPSSYYGLCIEDKCQWWITVSANSPQAAWSSFTTENRRVNGCAIALLPQMNQDGQLAV